MSSVGVSECRVGACQSVSSVSNVSISHALTSVGVAYDDVTQYGSHTAYLFYKYSVYAVGLVTLIPLLDQSR